MYQGVSHILYRTCTCYTCLPGDKPSVSKPVYVVDVVKFEIKLRLTKALFVGLNYAIIQGDQKVSVHLTCNHQVTETF